MDLLGLLNYNHLIITNTEYDNNLSEVIHVFVRLEDSISPILGNPPFGETIRRLGVD